MRIFKTRWLTRFARRDRIPDAALREAIDRAGRGLIDADLGGRLIKQRVARSGEGRRGGYRMPIGYREGDKAVFLFGFAKSDSGNITASQEGHFRAAGQEFLAASIIDIERQLRTGAIVEVEHD